MWQQSWTVRSGALRKRQLIDAFVREYRDGSYWSMRSDIEDYGLADPIDWRPTGTPHPADVPTRLKALDDETQRRIINWGYVVADTALRRWVFADQPRPSDLPLSGQTLRRDFAMRAATQD